MAFDTHSLLAYSVVQGGGVVGSTTGTSLQVMPGDSKKFSVNQNVTVWPAGIDPNIGTGGSARNAEIMRVTSIDTQNDMLTVTRAQEGLTPALSNIAVGYQVANTITPKVLTDIENQFPVSTLNFNQNAAGTTSVVIGARIEAGWYFVSTGANASVNQAVTFKTAFTNNPIVICTFGGDAVSNGGYGAGGANIKNAFAEAISISTSGFTARICSQDGSSWTNGDYIWFQWIAIGS
jgi:hypothetical protein